MINCPLFEFSTDEGDFDSFDIDERVEQDYYQGYIDEKGPNFVPWNKRENKATIQLDLVGSPDISIDINGDSPRGPSEIIDKLINHADDTRESNATLNKGVHLYNDESSIDLPESSDESTEDIIDHLYTKPEKS